MSRFSRKTLLNNRNNNKQYHRRLATDFNSKLGRFSVGLTMIELLIVLALVSLLIMLFFSGSSIYIGRARDSERKSDLEKIKVAFEDYYNDNECYPPEKSLNDCDGTSLSPYLSSIPCDPETDEPYRYYTLSGNNCGGFRVLTSLHDEDDTAITQLNCHAQLGCDPDFPGYNYGVGSGALIGDNSYWDFYGGQVNSFVCKENSGGEDGPTYSCGVYAVVPSECTGYLDPDLCASNCSASTSCN